MSRGFLKNFAPCEVLRWAALRAAAVAPCSRRFAFCGQPHGLSVTVPVPCPAAALSTLWHYSIQHHIIQFSIPHQETFLFDKPDMPMCCFAQRMRKSRKKNENFTSLSYNKKKNMKKRLQRLTACKMKGPCCKKAAGVVLCKQSFSRDKKAV